MGLLDMLGAEDTAPESAPAPPRLRLLETLNDPVTAIGQRSLDEGKPWSEAEKTIKDIGGDAKPLEGQYKMTEARRRAVDEPQSRLGRVASVLPVISTVRQISNDEEYKAARKKFDAGDTSPEVVDAIAKYEEEGFRKRSLDTSSTVGEEALKVPGMVAEFGVGGKILKGGAAALGLGAPTTLAGQAANYAGRSALTGAIMPSMAASQASSRSVAEVDDQGKPVNSSMLDLKNVAPALAKSTIDAAVLGSLQKLSFLNGVPTMAARSVAKGLVGVGEAAAGDTVGSVADTAIESTVGKSYKLNTKWGGLVREALWDQSDGSAKQLLASVVSMSLFAGAHEYKARTEGRVPAPRAAESPAPVKAAEEFVNAGGDPKEALTLTQQFHELLADPRTAPDAFDIMRERAKEASKPAQQFVEKVAEAVKPAVKGSQGVPIDADAYESYRGAVKGVGDQPVGKLGTLLETNPTKAAKELIKNAGDTPVFVTDSLPANVPAAHILTADGQSFIALNRSRALTAKELAYALGHEGAHAARATKKRNLKYDPSKAEEDHVFEKSAARLAEAISGRKPGESATEPAKLPPNLEHLAALPLDEVTNYAPGELSADEMTHLKRAAQKRLIKLDPQPNGSLDVDVVGERDKVRSFFERSIDPSRTPGGKKAKVPVPAPEKPGLFTPPDATPDSVKPRSSPPVEPTPEEGFTTGKGSKYILHEDGTTSRDKAARDTPGHEGDSGKKARSHKTVYVPDGDVASSLSAAGLSGLGEKGSRLVLKDGKATLLLWNSAKGRWASAPSGTQVPVSGKPQVGWHPLELWDRTSDITGEGVEAYKRQHAGSNITEIRRKPAEGPVPEQVTPPEPAAEEPRQVYDAETHAIIDDLFGKVEQPSQSPVSILGVLTTLKARSKQEINPDLMTDHVRSELQRAEASGLVKLSVGKSGNIRVEIGEDGIPRDFFTESNVGVRNADRVNGMKEELATLRARLDRAISDDARETLRHGIRVLEREISAAQIAPPVADRTQPENSPPQPPIVPPGANSGVPRAGVLPIGDRAKPEVINGKTWFHGTGRKDLKPHTISSEGGNVENLFGDGVYLTDSPAIAKGYANARSKKTGKEGSVYETRVKVRDVLELESPAPDAVRKVFGSKQFDEYREYGNLDKVLAKPDATPEQLIKGLQADITEHSHDNGYGKNEYADDFGHLENSLIELGYDGLTHTGGKRTGHEPHQVLILLDPNNYAWSQGYPSRAGHEPVVQGLRETQPGEFTPSSPASMDAMARQRAAQAQRGQMPVPGQVDPSLRGPNPVKPLSSPAVERRVSSPEVRAPIDELKDRLKQEGLSEREVHVLAERARGRTLDDIAADEMFMRKGGKRKGLPSKRATVSLVEKQARKKAPEAAAELDKMFGREGKGVEAEAVVSGKGRTPAERREIRREREQDQAGELFLKLDEATRKQVTDNPEKYVYPAGHEKQGQFKMAELRALAGIIEPKQTKGAPRPETLKSRGVERLRAEIKKARKNPGPDALARIIGRETELRAALEQQGDKQPGRTISRYVPNLERVKSSLGKLKELKQKPGESEYVYENRKQREAGARTLYDEVAKDVKRHGAFAESGLGAGEAQVLREGPLKNLIGKPGSTKGLDIETYATELFNNEGIQVPPDRSPAEHLFDLLGKHHMLDEGQVGAKKAEKKSAVQSLFEGEQKVKAPDPWDAESVKDWAATQAMRMADKKDMESQPEEGFYSGAPVPRTSPLSRERADVIPEAIKAADPEVERRLTEARGVKNASLFAKVKEIASAAWKGLTRGEVHLPKDGKFDSAREFFRLLKTIPTVESDQVNRTLAAIVDPMGPRQLAMFERKLVTDNLLASLDRGEPMRFGFKDRAAVEEYKAKLDRLIAMTPEVQKALETRQAIKKELVQQAVDVGVIDKSALDNEAYYHQMINSQIENTRYTGGSRPLRMSRSFEKARVTGIEELPEQFDYNTSYLEAEARWMTEMRMEVAKEGLLRKFVNPYDRIGELKDEAKAAGLKAGEWQKMLKNHPDLDVWSPEPGNIFYKAWTVPEKLAEWLVAEQHIDQSDLKQALVMGGLRRPMVIPKELAAQLSETMKPKLEGTISRAAQDLMGTWKAFTLFNPKRAVGYMLRNITGDAEPLVAAAPGALKYTGRAVSELHKYYAGDLAMSPELRRARDLGVIDASMTATEIPDVKDLPVFRRLYSEPGKIGFLKKLPAEYYDRVKKLNAFRESTGRYAAYLYYKDKLDNKQPINYGGAKKSIVDNLAREQGNDVAAAHLSRNLLGDYGNLTQFGQWARKHLAPFHSWTEVNFKRWPRLMENAFREAKDGDPSALARTGAAVGARAALNVAKLGSMYAAVWAWNNLVKGDEEKDLTPEDRASLHLNLGRNADGSVRVFRRVGSLSDFLDWFGVPELVGAAPRLAAGQETPLQAVGEMASGVANKAIQSVRPDLKTGAEIVTGQKLYPNAFKPQSARRDELAAQVIGGTDELKMAKGESIHPHYQQRLAGISAVDPGQSAMIEIRDLKDRFLESKGKSADNAHPPGATAPMRRSAQDDDFEAFQRAKKDYLAKGGDFKKFRESLDRLDPVKASLNAKDEAEFKHKFLTGDQRAKLSTAQGYAESTKKKMLRWWNGAK